MSEATQAQSTAIAAGADAPMWLRICGQLVRNKSLASIADQVLVSATNFLTTVIIGRAAGKDALGAYSLAFTVTLVVLCLQETLVCVPYTIEHRQFIGAVRRQYAGSAFMLAVFLGVATTLVLVVGGLAVSLLSVFLPLGLALAIAIAAPCVQLRDFARRMSFAHLVVTGAIAVDAMVLVLQLGLLLVLWQLGWLSAASAYLVIAIVCAAVGIFWLRLFRYDFLPPGNRLAEDMRHNWSLGRWILGSQIVSILSVYVIYWLVAISLGKGASGVLFACSAIILISNPITLGIFTYLTPRLAAALVLDGHRGVLRVALQTTVFLAAVMGALCLAAFMLGDVFLKGAYGPAFGGHAIVTGVFGLAVLAQAIGNTAEHALRVIRRPQICFWAVLIGLAVTIALAEWWISDWGLIGAVSAMAVGNAVSAVLRWGALLRLLNAQPATIPQSAVSN